MIFSLTNELGFTKLMSKIDQSMPENSL